jgi:hypothetical protein
MTGVRGSTLLKVYFVYSFTISSADNFTIRISLLFLLFILAFPLLLALVSLSLPEIIVLESLVYDPLAYVSEIGLCVESHTYDTCYCFFLSSGINLFNTKLILFPTF